MNNLNGLRQASFLCYIISMDLAVQMRDRFGKNLKDLRQQGLIPAELYGHGIKNEHLAVTKKEFRKVFKQAGENTIVNLVIDSKKTPVLIYNVSYHPVNDEMESVDFYKVRLDEKLKTKVPVEFVGESPAIKDYNGVLIKAMQEIEVEALPTDIPHSIKVDLSRLVELNQSFYVRDLGNLTNVKILIDSESVIAIVKPQITEEEEKAMAESAIPSVETIVVETEEKKVLRQAQGKTETAAEEGAKYKATSTEASPTKK